MGIVRTNKAKGFTAVLNEPFQRRDLSWEARGLLAYLLTKPDQWKIMMGDLIKQSPSGRDKTRRILRELEDAGHVHRHKVHDNQSGKWVWFSEVYEISQANENGRETTLTHDPSTGNPSTDNPSTENPSIHQRRNEVTSERNKHGTRRAFSSNELNEVATATSTSHQTPNPSNDNWQHQAMQSLRCAIADLNYAGFANSYLKNEGYSLEGIIGCFIWGKAGYPKIRREDAHRLYKAIEASDELPTPPESWESAAAFYRAIFQNVIEKGQEGETVTLNGK